jgi:4-hydroxybenzoate polyprenyltransferase
MNKILTSNRRAGALSTALFLVGFAVILYIDSWWPGIMLVIGIPLALRQFLLGRYHDTIFTLCIFVGFFIIAQFNISWKILVPILFIMAAIYILCKEWIISTTTTEDEKEEDLNKEIEEEPHKR